MKVERRNILAMATLSALPLLLSKTPAVAENAIDNRKLPTAFLDALPAHDTDRFESLMWQMVIFSMRLLRPTPRHWPAGAVVTYFAKRIEACPDLVVTSDISLTEGDLICANLTYTGTHQGEYLGIQPTGNVQFDRYHQGL